MSPRFFIQGADSQEVAQGLEAYLAEQGMRPTLTPTPPQQVEGARDLATGLAIGIGLATFVISIPSGIFNSLQLYDRFTSKESNKPENPGELDLLRAQRMEQRRKAKAIIEKYRELSQGKDVTVLVQGAARDRDLAQLTVDELLALVLELQEQDKGRD